MRCFGYETDGRTVVESEAEIVRDAANRILAGETIRAVVLDLRARGLRTSGKGPWTAQSLSRLLQNPRIARRRPDRGPAILEPAAYDALLAHLAGRSPSGHTPTNVRRHPLSGLLACGRVARDGDNRCGTILNREPDSVRVPGYVCRSGSPAYGCGRTRITAAALEQEAARRVLERLRTPRVTARLTALAGAAVDRPESVVAAIAALGKRLKEARRMEAERQLRPATASAVRDDIWRDRRRFREQLTQAARLRKLAAISTVALDRWWADAPLDQRQDLAALVLERVVVNPAERAGVRGVDVTRLEFVWK